MGLLLGVAVTLASTPEQEEALTRSGRELLPKLGVEIVKHSDDTKGFKVLPRRWVVESMPQGRDSCSTAVRCGTTNAQNPAPKPGFISPSYESRYADSPDSPSKLTFQTGS